MRSTLRHFREEYLTHIIDKKCPAGACKKLTVFDITDDCTGCGLCKRNCPVDAIAGEPKKLHVIDQTICTTCGACYANCPVDAIVVR